MVCNRKLKVLPPAKGLTEFPRSLPRRLEMFLLVRKILFTPNQHWRRRIRLRRLSSVKYVRYTNYT